MREQTVDGVTDELAQIGALEQALASKWVRIAHIHEGLPSLAAGQALLVAYCGPLPEERSLRTHRCVRCITH